MGGAHLPREEQQAGDVAAVQPAVAEGAEPGGRLARVERRHRLGRAGAEGLEHRRDAALDLRHGAEGEARGHEAHDLAIGVGPLRPDELERVRRHEPVVVLAVELLEPEPQVLAPHHDRVPRCGPAGAVPSALPQAADQVELRERPQVAVGEAGAVGRDRDGTDRVDASRVRGHDRRRRPSPSRCRRRPAGCAPSGRRTGRRRGHANRRTSRRAAPPPAPRARRGPPRRAPRRAGAGGPGRPRPPTLRRARREPGRTRSAPTPVGGAGSRRGPGGRAEAGARAPVRRRRRPARPAGSRPSCRPRSLRAEARAESRPPSGAGPGGSSEA